MPMPNAIQPYRGAEPSGSVDCLVSPMMPRMSEGRVSRLQQNTVRMPAVMVRARALPLRWGCPYAPERHTARDRTGPRRSRRRVPEPHRAPARCPTTPAGLAGRWLPVTRLLPVGRWLPVARWLPVGRGLTVDGVPRRRSVAACMGMAGRRPGAARIRAADRGPAALPPPRAPRAGGVRRGGGSARRSSGSSEGLGRGSVFSVMRAVLGVAADGPRWARRRRGYRAGHPSPAHLVSGSAGETSAAAGRTGPDAAPGRDRLRGRTPGRAAERGDRRAGIREGGVREAGGRRRADHHRDDVLRRSPVGAAARRRRRGARPPR